MRDFLRAAVFIGRGVVADVLAIASARVRPKEDVPVWLERVVAEMNEEEPPPVPPGTRAGDVTLSPLAKKMREDGEAQLPIPEPEPEPKPLKGSLADRRRREAW